MILIALLAAASWGLSDVLTGEASKRASPLFAAFWLYIVSLLILLPWIWSADLWATITPKDILIASIAGVAGVVGDIFFGRSLASSKMSVGIPLSNVIATAIPVLVACVLGEALGELSAMALIGAVLASVLAALPRNGHVERKGALSAMLGGTFFGLMFALLIFIKGESGLVIIFIMRLAGLLAMLPRFFKDRMFKKLFKAGAVPGALSGITSVVANGCYFWSLSGAGVTMASAIAIGLSAPFGVLMVNLYQKESLTKWQVGAITMAFIAIGLFAVQS